MAENLLEVEDLTVQYRTSEGMLTAVSDASFTFGEGEYFGVIGESGCGKSTMAKAILSALDENGVITGGTIRYEGQELQDLSQSELEEQIRWSEISYIPQGSMSSLDPLMKVKKQAIEIAQAHTELTKEEALEQFKEMFGVVGLDPERVSDYPHQFSGGMKQRAIIALALFLDPKLIVADEPTTALDVIMQDQIFKYLDRIKEVSDTSVMLITHDISLIFESCDRMAVMHGGQVAEVGEVTELFDSPRHPYAILLQEAFPDIRHPERELNTIEGNPPQQIGEIDYCTFVDRCPWAVEDCRAAAPPLKAVEDAADDSDHRAACIRKEEVHELYEQADERVESPSVGGE